MRRKMYYWLACIGENGRPYLISATSCHSEEEARMQGIETLGGLDFKIMQYPTMNLQAASSMHRGHKLKTGQGLMKSTQRQGHEKSVARLRRRMSKRDGL